MKKPFRLDHPVYNQRIYLLQEWSDQKTKVWLYKNKFSAVVDLDDVPAQTFVIDKDIFIWVNSKKFDAYWMGVLAHEVSHAINFMFKHAGVKLDIDNDEPYCYEVQWLFSRLAEKFK